MEAGVLVQEIVKMTELLSDSMTLAELPTDQCLRNGGIIPKAQTRPTRSVSWEAEMCLELVEDIVAEDMAPLSGPDRDWLKDRISLEVKTQIADATPKKSFIKEWGGVLSLGGMILFVLSQLVIEAYFRGATDTGITGIRNEIKTFSEINKDRFDKIDDRMERLEDRFYDLKQLGSLDQKSFAKALPVLRRVLAKPVSKVDSDPALLQEIAAKLRNTDPSTENYWPTTLQFIQVASAVASPSVPPPGEPQTRISKTTGIKIELSNQRVLLDGAEIVNSTLKNCRIIFTEKPTRMRNVTFIDCVFEMPGNVENPSPYLKKASQQLLASDLKKVRISTLS